MDALYYVQERNIPPMTSEWGYRETLSRSDLTEPIILVSTNAKISGYADLVYELASLEDVILNLKVTIEGWIIEPLIRKVPATNPVVACPYQEDNSLYKRLQQRKGREMKTLWKLGFPILLKMTDTLDVGFTQTRPGILFDNSGKIALLSPSVTDHLIDKLFTESTPKFETLGIWESSKRDV